MPKLLCVAARGWYAAADAAGVCLLLLGWPLSVCSNLGHGCTWDSISLTSARQCQKLLVRGSRHGGAGAFSFVADLHRHTDMVDTPVLSLMLIRVWLLIVAGRCRYLNNRCRGLVHSFQFFADCG